MNKSESSKKCRKKKFLTYGLWFNYRTLEYFMYPVLNAEQI